MEMTRTLAFLVVACGIVLALVTAMTPLPTGSYRLFASYLIFGVVPYVVFGSLTEVIRGIPLVTGGLSLLAVDLIARLAFDVTSSAQPGVMPAVWLCAVQLLLVLPAGAALGWLLTRKLA